jgi:hypothetical protein
MKERYNLWLHVEKITNLGQDEVYEDMDEEYMPIKLEKNLTEEQLKEAFNHYEFIAKSFSE